MFVADQILEGGKVVREEILPHDHHAGGGATTAAITQDQS